jgi:hypothetical protein
MEKQKKSLGRILVDGFPESIKAVKIIKNSNTMFLTILPIECSPTEYLMGRQYPRLYHNEKVR